MTGWCARAMFASVLLTLWVAGAAAQTGALPDLHARAEQGNAEAQFLLGSMYRDGTAVDQEHVEATEWFRRSAEQGYVPSFLPLAQAYLNGLGVPQDFVSAHLWFNLAAARLSGTDRALAIEQRDLVQAQMNQSQVAEAQQLAREWVSEVGTSGRVTAPVDVPPVPTQGAGLVDGNSRPRLTIPLTPPSQPQACRESRELGQVNASMQHGYAGWFLGGIGCGVGLGLIGTGLCTGGSALTNPQPRTLLDGIDENCYRDGYRGRAKKKNILATLGGGAIGTAVWLVIFLAK